MGSIRETFHGALPIADDPGDFTKPVERFLHEASVLPNFDLGDELQDLETEYGTVAATKAEKAYRNMKKEDK